MARVARKAVTSGGQSEIVKQRNKAYNSIKKKQQDAKDVAKSMNAAQKKKTLTPIKDKNPKVAKNKLSTIRDKSSSGVNKSMLRTFKKRYE